MQLMEENFSFLINETEVTFQLDWKEKRLLGHLQLNHPIIHTGPGSGFSFDSISSLLIPSKYLSLSAEAKGGVLEMNEGRYYFQMHSSGDRIPEGAFTLSQDPNLHSHPFLKAEWQEKGGKCLFSVNVAAIEADRISALAALFIDPLDYELNKGIAEVSATATLDPSGQLESYIGKFTCDHLDLSRGTFNLRGEHLEGTFTDTQGLALNLTGGEVLFDGHLYASRVSMARLPGERAQWKFQGKTELLGAFTIEGEEREEGAEGIWFFSDLDATVAVRINSFEPNGHLCSFSIDGWNAQQAQALLYEFLVEVPSFNDLAILDGKINGRCTLAVENGVLTSIDLEALSAKNARFTLMNKVVNATQFHGQGRFTPSGEGEMRVDILGTLGLETLSDQADHLSASFKVKRGCCEVSGAAKFGDENVQFGFESRRVVPRRMEEIFEAWIRADKLSHKLYGPLVASLCESIEVEGIFDLFGTFDGEKFELSLQSDALLLRHAWADMKVRGVGEKDPMLMRTKGRANLTYHLSNHCFHAELPLTDAALYQRHSGLVFDNMTGSLIIHHDPGHQSFALETLGAKASFDGKTLLTEIKSRLKGNWESGELDFEEFKGHASLPMEGEYYLSLPTLKRHLGRWEAEALLFDNHKTTLASLTAVAEKEFHAEVTLGNQLPISGDLMVGASFDKQSGVATIVCESEDLSRGEEHLGSASLRIKNQGSDWQIESAKWGKGSLSGIYSLRDGGLQFSEIIARVGGAFFQGSGMVFVDFPTVEQPFSLRAELSLDAELHNPTSLQLHTQHPLKIVYSPSMGIALSDLDLVMGSSHLTVASLEGVLGTPKWHAHNCTYQLKEGLIRSLSSNALLPEMVSALKLPEELTGSMNFDWENGSVKIQGAQPSGPFHFELDSNHAWSLTFGEAAHHCKMNGWVKDKEVTIERIQGEVGGQLLDLKGGTDSKLVGSATLNFNTLHSLIAVASPLRQVDLGCGFNLDGEFSLTEGVALGFKGRCRGSDFEAFGYHLRSLDTKVELTPDHLKLENCIIVDDAGRFTAQNILFSDGQIDLPRAEFKNFQPSFLRTLQGPEKIPSSLIIKTGVVEDFRGILGQPESFEGRGSLRFTGAPGNLQLPTALAGSRWKQSHFAPISGEADYILGQGRCFLTALRDCYSEKEGCAFTLSGNSHYFDFNGNLSVDMRLQARRGAPLDLELRGSQESPELILR
jgi:hypothetical protein